MKKNFFVFLFLLLASSSFVFAAQQTGGVNFNLVVGGGPVIIPAPVIIRAENITTNNLDLIVQVDSAYDNETLDFMLQVKNLFTGAIANVNYTQNTDVNARTSLAVSNLVPGTEYQFIVQYTRAGIHSAESLPYNAITVTDSPVLENVYDITVDSVKLLTLIDPDFINSTMDFVVKVNDNGNIYTVKLTQYVSNQHVVLFIDSLASKKEYSFRVKYARESTPNYSGYSNEKSITTKIEKEVLKPPVIIDIRNITTNSMELVVEIEGRAKENLDFLVHITNKTTGKVVKAHFSKVVDKNDLITFYAGGFDPGTEYEFKIKYSPENTNDYSDYSEPRSERTKYIEITEGVVICYNNLTKEVLQSELQQYLDDGAMEGGCVNDYNNNQIEICYNSQTILVSQEEASNYFNDGAVEGECPAVNSDEVEVCYENETIWVNLRSQIYQQSTPGKCKKKAIPLVNKEEVQKVIIPEQRKNIYQDIAIIGIGAGTTIAMASSTVPLFAVMPGAASGVILLQFIKLFGIINPRKKRQKWGKVFEKGSHLPVSAVKISLFSEDGEKIGSTYSDEDGRFRFEVDPGNYFLKVFKKKYKFVTNVEEDDIYEGIYDGKNIEVKENGVIKTINIMMKSKVVDWKKYGKIKSREYISIWSNVKKVLFMGLYVLGFISTIIATYFYPALWNFVVLGMYILLFLFNTLLKRRKYGFVKTSTGKPVPFAIVSLYDKVFNEKRWFAVADSIGRYYLLTDNGSYKLKVKNQSISGVEFEKEKDVFVEDGIVREKIII